MQATITYLLTEQAQREQMVATGQPVARKQTVTVEVPAEDIPLFSLREDGTLYLDYAPEAYEATNEGFKLWSFSLPHTQELAEAGCAIGWEKEGNSRRRQIPLITDAKADIVALIKQGRQTLLARQADADRKKAQEEDLARANGEHNRRQAEIAYRAFVADPSARSSDWYDAIRKMVPDLRSPANWWPEAHEEFAAEIKRRNTADAEAKKATEEAKEEAKARFIAEWIAAHADEDTKQQFTDGLLSRSAALSLIAGAAFEAAGVPKAAAKYDDSFCSDRDCPCGQANLDYLPRSIYPTWKTIKAGLPEGFTVKFQEIRECLKQKMEAYGIDDENQETAGEPIYLATITMPHGPFQLERTIQLN